MPCSCDSDLNWKACDNPVCCRCFVCDAALCEGCSRLVLTRDGFVRICGCTRMCSYALRVVAARVAS